MRAIAVGWLVALAALSVPNLQLWSRNAAADVGLYGLYGGRIAHGHVPYRPGFYMEFPPGAIPPLVVPALPRAHYIEYFHAFEALCLLGSVAAVAVALEGFGERRRLLATVVTGIAPPVLGVISLNSFDLWPALLAVAGIAAVVRGRPRVGLSLVAAAGAAKLYPLLLVPVLLLYVARTRGRRDARRALIAGAAAFVAIFLPFVAIAPTGVGYSLRVQATRGLQVESLGGSVLGAAHRLGAGFHVFVNTAPFSFEIAGGFANALATVMSLGVVVASYAVWRALRDGPVDRRRLLVAVAATATAFVAFSKVLSPQYLLFLVPIVPLAGSAAAVCLFFLALGLTQVWARFPEPFGQVSSLQSMIWVTLVRNLVLVALFVLLVRELRRVRPDGPAADRRYAVSPGEVSEWSKERDWKSRRC